MDIGGYSQVQPERGDSGSSPGKKRRAFLMLRVSDRKQANKYGPSAQRAEAYEGAEECPISLKLNNGTYVIKEPKTPHSWRAVALPPSLTLLLRQHRADQEALYNRLGKQITVDDFVFVRPDGSPINPNAITLAFARILKNAGLPHIRVHDLRHTHATLMLKAGVHPKVVSERSGHANVSITLDTYSHVLPWLQEAAA